MLLELRLARGMSQEALAECAGVSVRAISDLERGTTKRPQRETLVALAAGLSLDPDERARFDQAARKAPLSAAGRRPVSRPPRVPAPVSSILGREADIEGVTRLLRTPTVRLVTVCGTGGVGKTRLAAEVGWRIGSAFDEVDAVDLTPLRRADDVPAAVAGALRCGATGVPPADAVADRIGDTRWLLLLDSFEHVAPAAGWLADLLARCPRLSLLVTSRAALRLRGEHRWPLQPFPLPPLPLPAAADPSAPAAEPAVPLVTANPAVALLTERIRAIRPGFTVDARNAAAVVALCRRLDGLPLAIELAAAALRTQEPADLVTQLDSRFTELRSDTVDTPDRHQSLRGTVEWSTERLGEVYQLLLGVLGVFPGGATPAMVLDVLRASGNDVRWPAGWPTTPTAGALDAAVSVLATNSLITVVDRVGGVRITMLDTIREVAADLLATSGAAAAVHRAHAATLLALLRDTSSDPTGPDRLDTELDNLRAALTWTIEHAPSQCDVATVRALTGYFFSRSSFAEGGRTLATIAGVAVDEAARGWALHGAGVARNETGDPATAVQFAEQCAAVFAALGDDAGRGTAMTLAGNAYKALGRYAEAYRAHESGLGLAEQAGDPRRVTIALNNLGTLAHDRGDHALARRHYTKSLELKRALGDTGGAAVALMNLGSLDNDLGRHPEALRQLREATDILHAAADQHRLAFALALRAEAELGVGELDTARATATGALEIARRVAYRPAVGLALGRLGDLALADGDQVGAARLLQEALHSTDGAPEVARTLEHLAAARVATAPADAGRLLDRAAVLRRAHRTPVPPVDQAMVQRTADAVAGAED